MRILFDTHALIWFLEDNPIDRMLIAQARMEDMRLLSHDDDVIRYGEGVMGF